MTHNTVGIIIPPDIEEIYEIEDYANTQMMPYDQNITVAPYVCYSIRHAAKELSDWIRIAQTVLLREDDDFDRQGVEAELARLEAQTPEQRYQEQILLYDRFNFRGKPISTSNPAGKWHSYVVGGRWDGWLLNRKTSQKKIEDNLAAIPDVIAGTKTPFAVITPDGFWYERSLASLLALMVTDITEWELEFRDILAGYLDHRLLLIDAHAKSMINQGDNAITGGPRDRPRVDQHQDDNRRL